MAKRRKKKRLRPAPLVLMAVGILAVFWMLFQSTSGVNGSGFKGISYLQNQEKAQQGEIQRKITTMKLNQLGESIKNGDTTIFSAFSDAVIFGDSRVVGFDVFGFLPSKQVFAAAGNTIQNISTYVDQVAAMQPSYIYLSYGVNDMGLGIGSDRGENGYAQVYKEQIDKLLEVSPNSTIVVNSIIECTPATVKAEPNWGQTPKYNKQIKEMCKENGWIYVNNSTISKGGKGDFYAYDGVHFNTDFYPVWAENMIRTAIPDILGGVTQTTDIDTQGLPDDKKDEENKDENEQDENSQNDDGTTDSQNDDGTTDSQNDDGTTDSQNDDGTTDSQKQDNPESGSSAAGL